MAWEMYRRDTSIERVLDVLLDGKWHTPLEIGQFARCQHNTLIKDISFLRKRGYTIHKQRHTAPTGNDYFSYRLECCPECGVAAIEGRCGPCNYLAMI